MNQLNVSIFVRNDILAIVLTKNGMLITKQVERIKEDNIKQSTFLSLLFGIKRALLLVRNYLENNQDILSVVLEINNSTVESWLKNYYSKEMYQDSFVEVLKLLQSIPMQYTFVVNSKPKAARFADKKYLTTELKLTSFTLDEFE